MSIFLNKRILIYGLGKSGLSTFSFLRNKSDIFLYDDNKLRIKSSSLKKNIIKYNSIFKLRFDFIIISPGIDINKCSLSKYLKKNRKKIYSDLDVFYEFYKNDCITITGTNGKSTTCQILYEVLLNHKYDVRLVGNIGNPVLSVKDVSSNTIFVIEASSYQLEYSKIFKSKFAAILNLYPDHIERHKTFKKYINAKFKLLKKQSKGHFAFVKKEDQSINKELKSNKLLSKIIKVNTKKLNRFIKNINNQYFLSKTNKENLSFVFEILKKFKINKNLFIRSIENFKGLKYRQQIIFKSKYLTIINDSKSTSFSSSVNVLEANQNIFWLLGGIPKKGDKFDISRKYRPNIRAFIYGKNKKFFNKKLNGKIIFKNFDNLSDALKKIFTIIKKEKFKNKTILFSPCSASFDSFKNFEERGRFFNKLIKKHLNEYK